MRLLLEAGFVVAAAATLAALGLIIRDWRRTAGKGADRSISVTQVGQGALVFAAAFTIATVIARRSSEGVVLGDLFLYAVLFGFSTAVLAHLAGRTAVRERGAESVTTVVAWGFPLIFGGIAGCIGLA
ncbi:hypothetical protein ACFVYR_37675 [Streptomyces sp. NPDC058284]|uniref:hypothetical protein n=1 Tax=unclassified Streptomyces TaxID=2593676 RepID=UPI00364C0836